MARFRNTATGVEVEVADGKQLDGYEPVSGKQSGSSDAPAKAAPKKASTKK